MKICTIDAGTTAAKVILFDECGRERSAVSREYPVICDREDWAEQDAEAVFQAVVSLLEQCIRGQGVREVDGICLSVQGDAVIPVAQDGAPLMRAILGMDNRSVPQAQWCEEQYGAYPLFRRTGMRPHPINSAMKILWVERERPEIADRADKYLTYEGFLLKRMGAEEFVTDRTMGSRSMLCDRESGTYSGEILKKIGIARERLPGIVPSGTIVGRMSAELTGRLGLAERPFLITGGHDQTCAGVGAGAIAPGIAVDSHGTAEVLSTGFDSIINEMGMCDSYYPCYSHAVPGKFFTFALNHSGGIVFRWFRDQFAREEIAVARERGKSAYEILVEQMGDKPSKLLFLPHLNGSGTPDCDSLSRGSVMGLTLRSTKGDISRALLEGLAFEMRRNLQKFDELRIPVTDIRCVGGGASGDKALQLKADVLGTPISTVKQREAASLGALIIALTGLRRFKTIEEGVSALVKLEKTYEPRPEEAEIYSEKFETYERIGGALRPVYHTWR